MLTRACEQRRELDGLDSINARDWQLNCLQSMKTYSSRNLRSRPLLDSRCDGELELSRYPPSRLELIQILVRGIRPAHAALTILDKFKNLQHIRVTYRLHQILAASRGVHVGMGRESLKNQASCL